MLPTLQTSLLSSLSKVPLRSSVKMQDALSWDSVSIHIIAVIQMRPHNVLLVYILFRLVMLIQVYYENSAQAIIPRKEKQLLQKNGLAESIREMCEAHNSQNRFRSG